MSEWLTWLFKRVRREKNCIDSNLESHLTTSAPPRTSERQGPKVADERVAHLPSMGQRVAVPHMAVGDVVVHSHVVGGRQNHTALQGREREWRVREGVWKGSGKIGMLRLKFNR